MERALQELPSTEWHCNLLRQSRRQHSLDGDCTLCPASIIAQMPIPITVPKSSAILALRLNAPATASEGKVWKIIDPGRLNLFELVGVNHEHQIDMDMVHALVIA